jgi:hypothetical protein
MLELLAGAGASHRGPQLFINEKCASPSTCASADVGFEPVHLGPVREARVLEAMASAWINASYITKVETLAGGNWGFGVVRK